MKPVEFLFEREIIHSYAQKARSTGRGNPRGIIKKTRRHFPRGSYLRRCDAKAEGVRWGMPSRPEGGFGRRGHGFNKRRMFSGGAPPPRLTGATSERGRGTAGTQREARGRVGAVDTEGQRPVYDTSPALRGGGRTGTPELHAAQILGRG